MAEAAAARAAAAVPRGGGWAVEDEESGVEAAEAARVALAARDMMADCR